MNAVIARHLNVTEAAIVKVEEWANVLFCVVRGIGARFVSKKVVKMNTPPKKITYTYPTGQKMRLELAVNQGSIYKIYVDDVYHSQMSEEKVLKGFDAMTEDEKVSTNLQFIY